MPRTRTIRAYERLRVTAVLQPCDKNLIGKYFTSSEAQTSTYLKSLRGLFLDTVFVLERCPLNGVKVKSVPKPCDCEGLPYPHRRFSRGCTE